MKQTNRNASSNHQPGRRSRKRHGRFEMHRVPRRLLISILVILMLAILLAGYNVLYPVTIPFNTTVLNYQRSSSIDYQVQVKPNNYSDQTTLGPDQVYIRDFTESILARFSYQLNTDRAVALQYNYHIDAILRMHDAANPNTVLMQKTYNLLPDTQGSSENTKIAIDEQVSLKLADYDKIVETFKKESSMGVTFDLAVNLAVQIGTNLPGGSFQLVDTPCLYIPLGQQQFSLTRLLPDSRTVGHQQVLRYHIVLAQVPFYVYPALAGLCFLVLLIILLTTKSRKKDRFRKKLRRMMHAARSRLMVIGDKAWEPEWCITSTDFRSMVRTAKKLKHPIFCYVDWQSESPAAYFYVYYGENNYCYIFGSKPASVNQIPAEPLPGDDLPAKSEPEDAIPVLPETDDSPEILLSRLKMQTENNFYGLS